MSELIETTFPTLIAEAAKGDEVSRECIEILEWLESNGLLVVEEA